MTEIVVVTDSVAQIPPEIARQYGIGVIPFSVIINDQSYWDGIDILPVDLYQRMRTENISPKTSHPSIGEYNQYFRKYLDNDAQSLLYLTLSGKLSGAFSTASSAAQQLEAELPKKKIVVFDTKLATIAQGFIVLKAAHAAQEGKNLEHVLQIARTEQPKVGFIAMLETLKYLARGGRIGKAAYLAGSLLDIKPVLTINQEGEVTPIKNLRGDKNYEDKLIDCMLDMIEDKTPTQVAVMHADALNQAEKLKRSVQKHFNIKEVLVTDLTPAMGAHAGPGVLGLAYALE